jgi:hypothetical protein
MKPPETTSILLLLDPWYDNEVFADQITPQLAGKPPIVLRLSQFGLTRTRHSDTEIAWNDWWTAADAMLEAAEARRQEHPADDVTYYISGRAALPLFAYVGIRLSKWADVKVINRHHAGAWHCIDTAPAADGCEGERFFSQIVHTSLEQGGKIAVFISTEHPIDREKVIAYMRGQGHTVGGILEMTTDGRRQILTADNARAAAAQLDHEFQNLRTHFGRQSGVVMFIAGPAQLAAIAGRAVNTHIQGAVEFPNHARDRYVPSLRFPRADRDETINILALGASPNRGGHLDFATEFREAEAKLRDGAPKRYEWNVGLAVTVDEMMRLLHTHDPHILHLSAHGSDAGELGLLDETGGLHVVSPEAVIDLLCAVAHRRRVVVLHACWSDALAQRMQPHVDYTIGMNRPIHDKTAVAFAKGFYRSLGFGASLYAAQREGTAMIQAFDPDCANAVRGYARPGFDPRAWAPFPRLDR